MERIEFSNLSSLESEIKGLITEFKSFKVIGVGHGVMSDVVAVIERCIENQKLKCRVYTAGRSASMGGMLFSGVGAVIGAASAVGIAAHNLATYDPDYEIAKHIIDCAITAKYMHTS